MLCELSNPIQGTTTTESYAYDAVGNRLTSLTVPSYTYNSSNELTSTSAASYTYDNNGNTLTKTASGNTTQYAWDFENRLISVTLPGTGGTVAFKYDPSGRRIQKAFTQGSTTTTTNYVYDGANSVEQVDQNNNVLARYTQGAGIDEPLAESRSGTASLYEADGLGSVTSLTASAGTISNSYIYDTFGNLTSSSGTMLNPYQYTGRDFDPETGLRYYRARYYDSSTGRFLSEDPTGFEAGVNFYTYTVNNPASLRDPTGKSAGSIAIPVADGLITVCFATGVCEVALVAGGTVVAIIAISYFAQSQPSVDWRKQGQFNCEKCGKIVAQMYETMAEIKRRYYEMMTDPYNLFVIAFSEPDPMLPMLGTWVGHQTQLLGKQTRLSNLILAAKALGCAIPPEAEMLAALPLPTSPMWKKP